MNAITDLPYLARALDASLTYKNVNYSTYEPVMVESINRIRLLKDFIIDDYKT